MLPLFPKNQDLPGRIDQGHNGSVGYESLSNLVCMCKCTMQWNSTIYWYLRRGNSMLLQLGMEFGASWKASKQATDIAGSPQPQHQMEAYVFK